MRRGVFFLEIRKRHLVDLELLRRRHAAFQLSAIRGCFSDSSRECSVHRNEAFDNLFKVLPLFLTRVVVAVGVHFCGKVAQSDLHALRLDSLHGDVFSRCQVLDDHHSLMQSALLFAHNVGRLRQLHLLLGLVEKILMFLFLALQIGIIHPCHIIELLPARDLTSLVVPSHCNLLESVPTRASRGRA